MGVMASASFSVVRPPPAAYVIDSSIDVRRSAIRPGSVSGSAASAPIGTPASSAPPKVSRVRHRAATAARDR